MALRHTQPAARLHRFDSVYTNWYVIEEGGRLTIIDGGLPGDWNAFKAALSRFGHTMTDIDAVLLTHHHPDHRGNAERLRSHGARVYSHPADAKFVCGESQMPLRSHVPFLARPWYLGYMLQLLGKGVTRVPPVADVATLSDGEILDVPGTPRVIHVPGHTAGSCALLLEDRSVLLSGDALVTTDVTRGKRRGPQIIRGPVSQDVQVALRSLDLLAETNAETVLPGHGEPWPHGVKRAVDLARET